MTESNNRVERWNNVGGRQEEEKSRIVSKVIKSRVWTDCEVIVVDDRRKRTVEDC